MNLKNISESMIEFTSSYLETFIGILINPKTKFEVLIKNSESDFGEENLIDEKPVIYAAISTAVGLLIAASVSIQGTPDNPRDVIIQTVITQVVLWIIYALFIHYAAKGFGGKGSVRQTISGVLYVLGTLHPVLIICMYLLSHFFPDTLTYDSTLRRIDEYGVIAREYYDRELSVFGLGITGLYFAISFCLTAFYLYFPLKIAHNLSRLKIILIYIVGILALAAIPIISILILVLLTIFIVSL